MFERHKTKKGFIMGYEYAGTLYNSRSQLAIGYVFDFFSAGGRNDNSFVISALKADNETLISEMRKMWPREKVCKNCGPNRACRCEEPFFGLNFTSEDLTDEDLNEALDELRVRLEE